MELWNIIESAELNMLGMSGTGLGAVLLAIVALAVVLRNKGGPDLGKVIAAIAKLRATSRKD